MNTWETFTLIPALAIDGEIFKYNRFNQYKERLCNLVVVVVLVREKVVLSDRAFLFFFIFPFLNLLFVCCEFSEKLYMWVIFVFLC